MPARGSPAHTYTYSSIGLRAEVRYWIYTLDPHTIDQSLSTRLFIHTCFKLSTRVNGAARQHGTRAVLLAGFSLACHRPSRTAPQARRRTAHDIHKDYAFQPVGLWPPSDAFVGELGGVFVDRSGCGFNVILPGERFVIFEIGDGGIDRVDRAVQ